MRYRTALTIAAGTTQADPAWVNLDLEYGHITEVELMYPAGHAGLTFVQIYHQSRQIFPLTPGEAFQGDDHVIQFDERFPILEVPYTVTVKGWAPDATLAHTVYVDISMEASPESGPPEEVFVALPEGF